MLLSSASWQSPPQSLPNDHFTLTTDRDAPRSFSHPHSSEEPRRVGELGSEGDQHQLLFRLSPPRLDLPLPPPFPALSIVLAMTSASPPPPLPPHAGPSTSTRRDPDLLPVHDASPDYARRSLVSAARQLKMRGLDNAAIWALELVSCLSGDGNTLVGSSSTRNGDFFEEQARLNRGRPAPTNQGADSSLSWQGPFAPTSTPARPSSSRRESLPTSPPIAYPMQSTPFLGAAGGLASNSIMISGPSSSPLPVSSPRRNGDGKVRMLGGHMSPSPLGESMGREDASTSASGRFPPPFRQPPSPLATMSLSASTDRPSKSKDILPPDEDQSMLDGVLGPINHEKVSRSAHVHFAEGEADNSNVSKMDIFEAYSDPAQDSEPMDDAEFQLAMEYFRTGQLDRCKWALEKRREASRRAHGADEGDKARFLRGYVAMLVSSRRVSGKRAQPFWL
ncbi:hypothetical protein BCV69DRAFT_184304 [Microstroma glucosiphilum]|uniref:Uncharacterized protein n=1 Tax=Pseudomicrostroma glucosiphilum TaxID=1684307 RepID=A0A316U777_9BASI|nr:hypothetical protein BCV69DRAFT_184304 [Pseudomicrostroma glucosiphilum]PWN21087.1 hypothetical protein BCV69DRAFT_184304 [Pseudomicrostroma glucosiphilum]